MFSYIKHSIFKATGLRLPLINGSGNRVEVVKWFDLDYMPSHHIALRIFSNNVEHYLSFVPANLEGLSN